MVSKDTGSVCFYPMNCNVFYLFSSFRRNDPGDRLPCSVFILLLFAPMKSGGSHIGKNISHFAGRVFGQYDVIPRFTGCQPDGFARTTVENIPCRSLRVENAECGSVFGIRLFVYQPLGTRRDDEQVLNGSAVQNPREYPFAFYPSRCCVVQTVCPFDLPFSHQRAEEIELFGDSSTSFFAAESSAKFFYQIHFDNNLEAIGVGQVFIYAR